MSKSKKTSRQKTTALAVNAMLAAIIILMPFTPLGYLTLGPVKMTLIIIPVAVGAITMGPATGAFLGLVFGITSFVQCFGIDPFGTTLMGINPIYTAIMCIVPRALMGYLCAWIFIGVKKLSKGVAYVVASLSGAILNTVFFMSLLILFFGKSDYIMGFRGELNIFAFLVAFVGINGLCEIIAAGVIGAPASADLTRLSKD